MSAHLNTHLDKLTVAWLTLVKHEHLQQLKTKGLTSVQQTIVHAMCSLQIKIKSPPFLRLPVWIASLLHVAKRLRSDCARRKKVYRLLHRKLVGTHVIKYKLMLEALLSCIVYMFWPYLCHVDAHIIITIVTWFIMHRLQLCIVPFLHPPLTFSPRCFRGLV